MVKTAGAATGTATLIEGGLCGEVYPVLPPMRPVRRGKAQVTVGASPTYLTPPFSSPD